jgi:uncharacterized membrane protein (UPF0127 family)
MQHETSLSSVLKARNLASATVIADAITVADTSLRRAIGLLRHKRLEQGAGLWIRPCSGVHTFGMSFAIDVIGLDKNMYVVRLWPGLRPNRMTAIYPSVRTVLELASGTISTSGISLGDQLILE